MHTPALRSAFSDQLSHSNRLPMPRPLIALAISFFFVPALFAQQEPDNRQYAPDRSDDQQSGYEYPGYAQQQPNGQQSYPEQPYSDSQMDSQQGYRQVQPLSAQELEQLVAPIALYPDTLVAQVLTASTYPQQLADADRWRRAERYASSEQIAAGADAQPWDPSVKALTAFPQVLAQMDYNLQWATELGNAYYNQPQDLLEAVQVMRQRAQEAGNLRSTPQQAVNYDQGNIELAPVNPQMVYVPEYNPWGVYGQPVSPYPGFSLLGALGSFVDSSLGSSLGSGAVQFGLGIAMTAFSHTPFGLLAWGLNWLTQSVLFQGSNYYSHSNTVADWGLRNGGRRGFSRGGEMAGQSNRPYGRQGYGRWNSGYGGTRSQGFSRTPDRDAYARNGQAERYGRGYQPSRIGYARSSRGAYNNFRPAVSRPQQYGRSGYGSASYNRSEGSYGGRTGAGYGNSMRAYSNPGTSFQRGDFGQRSSRSLKSNGFAEAPGKQAHSGGFHFGGGHAPKNSGGEKSFRRGHSGGGGHFGGHSGGGHSGGGHSGGHSGGKHHH
jgi:hypothetical protein